MAPSSTIVIAMMVRMTLPMMIMPIFACTAHAERFVMTMAENYREKATMYRRASPRAGT
jgi:hypothetical protein